MEVRGPGRGRAVRRRTSPLGKALDPTKLNAQFDARIRKAGVRRITVHGTRGTCATLLAALDVHPRVAMRILRHSNIKMTMEVYTDATDEATYDALRRLGGVLDSPLQFSWLGRSRSRLGDGRPTGPDQSGDVLQGYAVLLGTENRG
ncbi:hypothetical protein FDA94_29945 [Herbidospora galbida]|uniref:Tyr recombinase domain-containing protein n=1 Tax=Herbidospora galbida TaxID=2575442 RepID=A0A4U3M7W5_9ACTN|nr:hypothetical protein FDA94_29945 [Herbidospora galbida]